jgi:hypothetical protein
MPAEIGNPPLSPIFKRSIDTLQTNDIVKRQCIRYA